MTGSSGTFGGHDDSDCGPRRDGRAFVTDGNDVIDAAYRGDPDGDRVDARAAIIRGAGLNDDVIYAGDGNDILKGGKGMDRVFGGADRDTFAVTLAAESKGNLIDGGQKGDDVDALDLRGAGPLRIYYATRQSGKWHRVVSG